MKETQGQPITAVTKLASERFKALGDEELNRLRWMAVECPSGAEWLWCRVTLTGFEPYVIRDVHAQERAAYQKKYEEAKAKFEEDMKAFLEAGVVAMHSWHLCLLHAFA